MWFSLSPFLLQEGSYTSPEYCCAGSQIVLRFSFSVWHDTNRTTLQPTAYTVEKGAVASASVARASAPQKEQARPCGSAMSSLVTLVKFFIDAAAQARTSARRVPDEPAATRLVLRRPPARRAWRCARVSFAPGSSTALSALSRHAGSSAGLVGSRAALTRTLKSAAGAAGSTFGSRCGELRLAERVLCTSAGTAATSQPRRRVLSHLALVDVQLRS